MMMMMKVCHEGAIFMNDYDMTIILSVQVLF